jgi:hypothetical protein
MSVIFGSIASGFSVSSSFQLTRANRPLYVGISSHAAMAFFLTSAVDGGPYLKAVLDQAVGGNPLACFSGTGGAWGLVPVVPTANVRLESASNVLATTSFTLLEVAARP